MPEQQVVDILECYWLHMHSKLHVGTSIADEDAFTSCLACMYSSGFLGRNMLYPSG